MKKFIYSLRKHLGMSQPELGSIIGVSQGTVGHWENGIRFPSEPHLKKIIKFARKNGMAPTIDDLYPNFKRNRKRGKPKKKEI